MGGVELSKVVSHALRHDPGAYGLILDQDGWVAIDALLAALRAADPRWAGLGRDDLTRMVQGASKQRHEISGARIRASYGHSIPQRVRQAAAVPPAELFHGTPPETVERILSEGLQPMRRQYVHLSTTIEVARTVGRRRSAKPAVLAIDAAAAHAGGIAFYVTGEPRTWLADHVPGRHLRRIE